MRRNGVLFLQTGKTSSLTEEHHLPTWKALLSSTPFVQGKYLSHVILLSLFKRNFTSEICNFISVIFQLVSEYISKVRVRLGGL